MSSDDILQPLSAENWKLLAQLLKKNWPSNIQVCIYFIENNIPIVRYT